MFAQSLFLVQGTASPLLTPVRVKLSCQLLQYPDRPQVIQTAARSESFELARPMEAEVTILPTKSSSSTAW